MGGAWRALDIDLSGRISLLELMPKGGVVMVILVAMGRFCQCKLLIDVC